MKGSPPVHDVVWMKEKIVKRNRRMDLGDKGYSLVELIVAILITSVLTGMIVVLISTSRTTYSVVNTEAVIQTEAETVRGFIGEIAIEASQYGVSSLSGAESISGADTCIWFLSPDNESAASGGSSVNKYCYYFILHEAGNDVLRYGKYDCDTTIDSDDIRIKTGSVSGGTTQVIPKNDPEQLYKLLENDSVTKIKDDKYSLLAEHITKIECTEPTKYKGLITFGLTLEYNGETQNKSFVFAGRNRNNQ